MRILITTDLHLTDATEDKYRWELFPWLCRMVRKYAVTEIFVLGDITDRKDYHSSVLINHIVDSFFLLVNVGVNLTIIRGNHDCQKNGSSTLEFLNYIPGISFWSTPEYKGKFLFLPHTINNDDWKEIFPIDSRIKYVFMHHTFGGAVASNGFQLEGLSPEIFKGWNGRVFSGDIHVPQKVGIVEYVGAPYPIRFGDSYDPRVVILDTHLGETENLIFDTIRKSSVVLESEEDVDRLDLEEGDQLKVVITPDPFEYDVAKGIEYVLLDLCEKKGVYIGGISIRRPTTRRRLLTKGEQKRSHRMPDHRIVREYGGQEGLESSLIVKGVDLL